MSVQLREATVADNPALIELTRASPMVGALTAYVDRAPDFFAISSLQGQASRTFVAHHHDRVVGCVSCVDRRVTYAGHPVRQLYAADMKVHPSARGSHVGAALSRFAIENARGGGYDMAMSEVMGNNTNAVKLIGWINDNLAPAQPGGLVRNTAVLPFRSYSPIKGYDLGPARSEDLGCIADLLHKTYRTYNDSPVFDQHQLSQELNRDPSFSLSSFRVARRDGTIVACAAYWDQDAIRRTVVLRYNWQGVLLVKAVRMARRWLALADPPSAGHPLRCRILRFPACAPGHLDGLRALVRDELEAMRRQRYYHFLSAAFHEADPLQGCLDGLWKTSIDALVFHASMRDSCQLLTPEQAARTPTYVDPSLV